MALIGISGSLGSGKDTVGKIIQHLTNRYGIEDEFSIHKNYELHTDWKVKKFASKLKEIASIITGVDIDEFEKQNFKNTLLPEYLQDKEGKRTYRWLLQTIGTESFRDIIHKDIWVNVLMKDYNKKDKWIITDVRFKNEADAIRANSGVLIQIVTDSKTKDPHVSENDLSNYKFDFIIKNDKKDYSKLINEVKLILPKICK